jgi:hypothetical protein
MTDDRRRTTADSRPEANQTREVLPNLSAVAGRPSAVALVPPHQWSDLRLPNRCPDL